MSEDSRTRATQYINLRRADRLRWPDWLGVRTLNVLHRCGIDHPSDILMYAPHDLEGAPGVGPAVLRDFARLYREEAAKMKVLWEGVEGE